MKTFTILLVGITLAVLAFTVEAAIKPCKDAEADSGEGDLMASMKTCMEGLKDLGGDPTQGFKKCKEQLKSMFKGCAGKSKLFQKLGDGLKKLKEGGGLGGKAGLSQIKEKVGKVFDDIQGKFKNWSKNKGSSSDTFTDSA